MYVDPWRHHRRYRRCHCDICPCCGGCKGHCDRWDWWYGPIWSSPSPSITLSATDNMSHAVRKAQDVIAGL